MSDQGVRLPPLTIRHDRKSQRREATTARTIPKITEHAALR